MKQMPKTGCVEMVGPDVQMDQHGSSYEPANRLPAKCHHCSFPDLDFVPEPYVLTKGVTGPSEISPAQMGNFLVRKRVRQMLEVVVPQACAFYPTIEKKTQKATDWSLAVPKSVLSLPGKKADQPLCSKCGEPKHGYVFADHISYVAELKGLDIREIDVFKSQQWGCMRTVEDDFADVNRERQKQGIALQSWKEHIHWAMPGLEPPTHPERWTRRHLTRDLFFSLRLEQLVKRVKVKRQLVTAYHFKDVEPCSEDEEWIEQKLQFLAQSGLADSAKPAHKAGSSPKWFKEFLKRNAVKRRKPLDFASVERRHNLALPRDYKEFVSVVGSKTFADVSNMEGSTTTLLLPQKLDFKNYRRGKVPHLHREEAGADGVMFAEVDNGDCFVFDVSAKSADYPIFWFRHEENEMQLFASSFAECIRRFSEQN